MLNRRRFLMWVITSAGSALAACRAALSTPQPSAPPAPASPAAVSPATPSATAAPSPTPTPRPVEVGVWVDPALPGPLTQAASERLAAIRKDAGAAGLTIVGRSTPGEVGVRLTTRPTNGWQAVTVAEMPLALVTSPRVPVLGLTMAQAEAIRAGSIANWSEVGSPLPIPLSLVDMSQVRSYDDVLARLNAAPGAVALVPVDQVDYRVHALRLDEVDLLAHPEQASSYPLRQSLYLEVAPDAPSALRSTLTAQHPSSVRAVGTGNAVTVTVVGDIILGRSVNTIMMRLGDYAAPFRLVADELKRADLTIGDLECSLSDTIAPPTDPYTFLFITSAAAVDGLTLCGIDGVSQANNHSMNFGPDGMHDTLAALDKAGIAHFGIGDNLAAARQPGVFDVRGTRFAFLGYDGITADSYGATPSSAGTSPLVVENLVADITAARNEADLVIPFIHWGVEYTLTPTDEQRRIARRAIDAGADMVVGSHPHWIQGMEIYQGKPIVYSLANFVFDQDWSEETKQGLIMHLTFHGTRLVALRFVPVYIEDFYRPRIVDGAEMVTILSRVWDSTDQIQAAGSP